MKNLLGLLAACLEWCYRIISINRTLDYHKDRQKH